jgi:cytochrome P450
VAHRTGQDTDGVPDFPFARPDAVAPPPEWGRLREECPIADVRLVSGDRALLLTRIEDVRQLLKDPRFGRQLDPAKGAARLSTADEGTVFTGGSDVEDLMTGGDHTRWRRLVGRAFTARRVNGLRPQMREIAEACVDRMRADGDTADLVAEYGFPIPVEVICALLGTPAGDVDRFSYWSETMLSETKYEQDEILAAQAEFAEYMLGHIAAKRADPGEDLLSELASGTDGAFMTDEQLMVTGIGLLVAGHETTANMIGKMVTMLLAERSRWEVLLADRSLIRTAVEESLRMDANMGVGLPRFVTEETALPSGELCPRSTVISSLSAANRDPRAFADPDRMDLARSPNPHIAFGAGAHSCIGQALARTELQVALEVLLEQLPTLELAVPVSELQTRSGVIVGGLAELPVRW